MLLSITLVKTQQVDPCQSIGIAGGCNKTTFPNAACCPGDEVVVCQLGAFRKATCADGSQCQVDETGGTCV